MPHPMTDKPRMTAVFEYDLKQHPGNPFHTDTPFGRPLVLQPGDFSEVDCEAVAEDRGTANPTPYADLCADPALLAEAVEVLRDAVAAWELHNETGDMMQGHWAGDARAFIAKLENRHDR